MKITKHLIPAAIGVFCLGLTALIAAELPAFDFTQTEVAGAWRAAHDIARLTPTPAGLVVRISGADPYLFGPSRDYPPGTPLWLHLRLKSDQAGTCQVFYFRENPTEPDSVRLNVAAGDWVDAQVPLPALGAGYRLRIDPPGNTGECVLGRLWVEERVLFQSPEWPKPEPVVLAPDALTVESGDLRLTHNRDSLGAFRVQVAGKRMADGNRPALIGYLQGRQVRWLRWGTKDGSVAVEPSGTGIRARAQCLDPDGAHWSIEQIFTPDRTNAIQVETRVTVDQERQVIYLPMVTLLAGLGSYGTNKHQALFPGLEYLENEPSSSQADLIGPASKRQVPDNLKITFPLMSVQAEGRYVGLIWQPQPDFAAVFDSPDRLFDSAAHVLGILFPGANETNREEGSLLPYQPERLAARQPLVLRATLVGGLGESVVAPVQQYVQLRGWPQLPDPGLTAPQYFQLAAHGWLDSKIREGNRYRHAAWPGFGAQPAADAAVWMEWLAGKIDDPSLTARLTNAAAAALGEMPPARYNAAQIGHIRYPLPVLVFGQVAENADQARARGNALRQRFAADGSVSYHAPAGGVDYAKTHGSLEANGLTAAVVVNLLEDAVFSGDRELIREGLRCLRAMDKFNHTVPRGAQTWEIPLHTPDILASGHLVHAYTLGYELTGDAALLEQARYWAWTGVPFIYLTPPTPNRVGLYSTIPVLGATGWAAPVWIGLPVQWCGLVYGDALNRLARSDPSGPWKQLANGIAIAGIQHTWPLTDTDRQGLLPDSYQLRAQLSDGPAINPGTVQVAAVRSYGYPPPYTFHAFRHLGWLVHAPGELSGALETTEGVKFSFSGWSTRPNWILINGVEKQPQVKIDGQEISLVAPIEYSPATGRLILPLPRRALVEVSTSP